MTIEQIYYYKSLSVRSFNVCNNNGIKDLTEILSHYNNYGTFINIRNCGVKSNEELIDFCLKYINVESNSILKAPESNEKFNLIFTNFTRTQREIINNFIKIKINNLSVRGKNSISIFLDNDLSLQNVIEKIIANNHFDYNNIKNAGAKTLEELKELINSIKDFCEEVSKLERENDIVILRNKLFIESYFSIKSSSNQTLETNSIFGIVDFLIRKNILFEEKEKFIFQNSLKIYEDQIELSLSEIGEQINITKERVRQIRLKIIENLFNKLQFVKYIDDDIHQKYGIDQNQDIINIDTEVNKRINEVNNSNFSIEFNSCIIFAFLSDEFKIVGEIEDILLPKNFKFNNQAHWNNCYLVKNEIINIFYFNDFFNDIKNRLISKIDATYSFHLKSYLTNFFKKENYSLLSNIERIAQTILNKEFDFIVDNDDNLVFEKNTYKKVSEYAIDALTKLGAPSKVEKIYEIIEADYPGIIKSQETLRACLQRTPELIYFGRSSTYGIKKWEIEKEGIKGGTIKDIIYEYLFQKEEPIHIIELLNEVHKYREKTNSKNVITNLKLDPQNQFIVYNQSFIGLRANTYNSKLTSLPKFLGKKITSYITKQKNSNRLTIEKYFSNLFGISEKNISYILDNLINYEFIFINKDNNLKTCK
jgi:hypothetical protein